MTESILAKKNIDELVKAIPYAKTIGVQCIRLGDHCLFKLPQNDDNIGNPTLPAIHGGVLAGFMETAAVLHVMLAIELQHIPKIVDFSIDYLSPGRHRDSFAQCEIVRQGKKIVNVMITAWQRTQDKPIATARAHFLLIE